MLFVLGRYSVRAGSLMLTTLCLWRLAGVSDSGTFSYFARYAIFGREPKPLDKLSSDIPSDARGAGRSPWGSGGHPALPMARLGPS